MIIDVDAVVIIAVARLVWLFVFHGRILPRSIVYGWYCHRSVIKLTLVQLVIRFHMRLIIKRSTFLHLSRCGRIRGLTEHVNVIAPCVIILIIKFIGIIPRMRYRVHTKLWQQVCSLRHLSSFCYVPGGFCKEACGCDGGFVRKILVQGSSLNFLLNFCHIVKATRYVWADGVPVSITDHNIRL